MNALLVVLFHGANRYEVEKLITHNIEALKSYFQTF